MVFKVIVFMIFLSTVSSATLKEEDFFIHDHSDDYDDYEYDDDEVRNIQTDKPQAGTAKPSYEVTEDVDDIPNNIVYTGPVVTNFTIKLPLNNGTVKNNTNINDNGNKNNDKDVFDNFYNGFINEFDGNPQKNKNLKKNSISIFHVNAEFGDDKDGRPLKDIHINQLPSFNIFNVKDHVDRFKDGIVNHIHKVHNKEVYNDVNNGFVVPNIVAGPVSFLGKLHKKGSAIASKLHNVLFGSSNDY